MQSLPCHLSPFGPDLQRYRFTVANGIGRLHARSLEVLPTQTNANHAANTWLQSLYQQTGIALESLTVEFSKKSTHACIALPMVDVEASAMLRQDYPTLWQDFSELPITLEGLENHASYVRVRTYLYTREAKAFEDAFAHSLQHHPWSAVFEGAQGVVGSIVLHRSQHAMMEHVAKRQES